MADPITYARAPHDDKPGVPDDWYNIDVFSLDTGEKLRGVLEVNTAEGWARCRPTHAGGALRCEFGEHGRLVEPEIIRGRFELRPRTA